MRLIPYGTPSRTKEYLRPRRRLGLFWASLAGSLAVAAALSFAVLGGAKTVASPARLSSAHAPFEAKCAACHAPSVADVRCEYCHDPFGSNRYRNAGHVWFGTKDLVRVAKAVTIDCGRCHSDHHERDFLMTRVDERDCSRCHFPTMGRHPEFAVVKARVMREEGLRFTHNRHIDEMRKARLEPCASCHEPTRDRRGFEAISFDRHCARCHAKDGILGSVSPKDQAFNASPTDPIPRRLVVLPEEIEAPWAQALALAGNVKKQPRDRVVVERLQHQDPWVITNLWKISREVDPEGLAAKRASKMREIERLNFLLREPPTRGLTPATLRKEEGRLSAQLAALARDPGRAPERGRAEQDLARVRVQMELGPLQMTAPRPRDRSQLEAELALRQSELKDFDIAAGPAIGLDAGQRAERLNAVVAMTSPCVKCHIYDGSLMKPVRAAVAVLERAQFTHLPHVQQRPCESCHARIRESKKAEDVNLPGIATCQSCHRAGKSRADCAECHRYHPPSEPWPPI